MWTSAVNDRLFHGPAVPVFSLSVWKIFREVRIFPSDGYTGSVPQAPSPLRQERR